MTSSTGRLRRLVADLLTASRLEASSLEMRMETVQVGDVLDQAVAVVRRAHPDAEIVAEAPAGLAVTADRDRLAQALENLLGNALRHGASPVHVTATATEPGTVEIRVRDSGPGVPEAVRPRLFSRFATGAATGGTGLGLFIVRELVRAQGGEATYEPGPPGSAAGEFVVRLPGPAAPLATRRFADDRAPPCPAGRRRGRRTPAGPHRPALPRQLRGRGRGRRRRGGGPARGRDTSGHRGARPRPPRHRRARGAQSDPRELTGVQGRRLLGDGHAGPGLDRGTRRGLRAQGRRARLPRRPAGVGRRARRCRGDRRPAALADQRGGGAKVRGGEHEGVEAGTSCSTTRCW